MGVEGRRNSAVYHASAYPSIEAPFHQFTAYVTKLVLLSQVYPILLLIHYFAVMPLKKTE
jgi:hypothetical protein